jgi:hypothetical protein
LTLKETLLFQKPFHGFVSITDNGLAYDNTLYFTISKIKRRISFVLARQKTFLSRIYTDSEFNFVNSTISSLDYNSIEKQDVIVLNELDGIPQALQTTSRSFVKWRQSDCNPFRKDTAANLEQFLIILEPSSLNLLNR